MTNLKPCPFCGGEGVAFKFGVIEEFGVRCDNCGAQTDDMFDSYAAAEEAWNRRYKRTCHQTNVGDCIKCSECGNFTTTRTVSKRFMPRFCGSCGAEVVDGN